MSGPVTDRVQTAVDEAAYPLQQKAAARHPFPEMDMTTPQIPSLSRWSWPLLAAGAVATLALTGCKAETVPSPVSAELRRLGSCGELRDYATDVMLETAVESRYGHGLFLDSGVADSDDSGGARDGGPTDFTTTNVQEEGVDELDIVKTDGNFIYVAQDRALHIVRSWPVADSEKLATLELRGWVRGLFLRGDRAVVFYQPENMRGMDWGLRAAVVDVTDRAAPEIVREVDIEGHLADARMIDDDVYFVVNHYLPLPEELWRVADGRTDLPEVDWTLSGDALIEDMDRVKDEARELLRPDVERIARDMDLADFLPEWRDSDGSGELEVMHACSDLYRPDGVGHHGGLSVVNLDLADGTLSSSGILSAGWQLYASRENLYVAQSSRWWWWGGWDRELTTHIHKFHLEEDGEPTYTASGEVRGWAYDQFAFSEHEGRLRVATSDMDWWWGWGAGEEDDGEEPANNLFVLEDDGAGSLDVIGEVTGIAPTERIYATRYMGDVAYMVTFRQVDPLFTIDLSEPTSPEVLGELKIPGYSAYLHPMGEDHLLAVGMDGNDAGQLLGLQFSLFDVSDLSNPTRTHTFEIEGSDWSGSEALWNHHAFTYHRDVLTVPFYAWYDGRSGDDRWFSGVISLRATTEGFSEVGRVDHRPLVSDSECLWARWWDYPSEACNDGWWYARVRRSIYIEDNLFSLSDYGLRVTDLNDPSVEHARVLFYPEVR